MPVYRCYDLTLSCPVPLRELAEADDAHPDITVRIEPGRALSAAAIEHPEVCIGAGGGEITLCFKKVGIFRIRNGTEIVVEPLPERDDRAIALIVIGPALGIALHQRGHCAFHAAAASIGGRVAAFSGHKGVGKSTVVASLLERGHSMVCDDIVALAKDGDWPAVLPGFAQLKLMPESVASLGVDADALAPIHPTARKRAMPLGDGVAARPGPLAAIYLPTPGLDISIEPYSPGQAIFELIAHWYGSRYGSQVVRELGQKRQFEQCMRIARKIRIFRLRRPRSLDRLEEVAARVEEHFANVP